MRDINNMRFVMYTGDKRRKRMCNGCGKDIKPYHKRSQGLFIGEDGLFYCGWCIDWIYIPRGSCVDDSAFWDKERVYDEDRDPRDRYLALR